MSIVVFWKSVIHELPLRCLLRDKCDKVVTIVFLSDIPWHGLRRRPQHLAARLKQRWPVLWVEPVTLVRMPRFTPAQVEPNLHILNLPVFPYNARFKPIRLLARLLGNFSPFRQVELYCQLWILRRALQRLKTKEIGFLVQNFHLGRITRRFEPKVIAFDYIDNAFGFAKLPRQMHDDWVEMIKTANVVTVTSGNLRKQVESAHTVQAHLISNGVEYDRFAPRNLPKRPSDLPGKERPIIVYAGAVNKWFDFELLESLLGEMRDSIFVVIGTDHPEIRGRIRSLSRFPNFSFLGFRPYHTIPAYLNHCTVGIIPFKKNALTAGVNPVKLYEYSAAGLPTVSTDFSEDLAEFNDLIFVARSPEEFRERIRSALKTSQNQDFKKRLRYFAGENDWNTKVEALKRLIEGFLTSHPEGSWQKQES